MPDWAEFTLPTRAYALVERPSRPRCLLIGFHGYAEDPSLCLEGLRRAGIQGAILAAPMGQHHFYNRAGEVVASWMTSFRREDQVEQILSYARELIEGLDPDEGGLPLYLMGFSQGAATAYRVAALGGLKVERLFILAGDMPPEVRGALETGPPVATTLLWGEEDRRVPRKPLDADLARLNAAGWPCEMLTLEGGHDYFPAAMELMGRRIEADLVAGE
jgi:predicted esterase